MSIKARKVIRTFETNKSGNLKSTQVQTRIIDLHPKYTIEQISIVIKLVTVIGQQITIKACHNVYLIVTVH